METEVYENRVQTLHVLEPDYSFVFGSVFDDDGDISYQQFQHEGERILIDPDEAEAYPAE